MECVLKQCDNGGYLLETKSYYDTVIQGKIFTVAHNREQEELILYDKNFIMIQKYDSIKSVEEYRFDDAVFALLDGYVLLALDDKRYTTSILVDNFYEPETCREIYYISPKKYLVITEFKPENVEFYRFEFYIINLNEKIPNAQYFARCAYSYHLKGNCRFLEYDNRVLYDLLTEREIELPDGKDLAFCVSKASLETLYSSKDFLVIFFDNLYKLDNNVDSCEISSSLNYCLYINGKLVHIFEGEEYKEILPKLQELSISTCRFKTLVIKDQLWVWTADEVPQAIPIDSFLKVNQ